MTAIIDLVSANAISLVSGGASITNGGISAASSAFDRMATLGASGGGGYKHGLFRLSGTFSVAPTEGGILVLKYAHQDIVGTSDEQAAEAGRGKVLGAFAVDNVTTAQVIALCVRDLPFLQAKFYLYNQSTGQTLGSGWSLDVLPFTDGT